MEDYIPKSDIEIEDSITELYTFLDKLYNFLDIEEAKCCFCGSIQGALIRLHQGWCCMSCFKYLLQGWEGK